MFGVLTMHLARLVNYGHSYEDAADIFNLLSEYPLSHTYTHLYEPKRKYLPFPKPKNANAGLSNFYFFQFDNEKGTAVGKYHSKDGTETKLQSHPQQGLRALKRRQRSNCTAIDVSGLDAWEHIIKTTFDPENITTVSASKRKQQSKHEISVRKKWIT